MSWVFDLDGVIWLGDAPIAGAADAVARVRATGAHTGYPPYPTLSPLARTRTSRAGRGGAAWARGAGAGAGLPVAADGVGRGLARRLDRSVLTR
ncbi:MAG: hypothetical protein HGA44_18470 [Cellulomonadaceae bacterium]|nr:hypothetical protein [Cellulomonadaceae bacterium]